MKTRILGPFPGGVVIETPPSNAGGGGLVPGGRALIPCGKRQLSLWASAWRLWDPEQQEKPRAKTEIQRSQ